MDSPAYTQTWMVEGKILGSAPIGLESTCTKIHPARSYAFSCPHCGDVWARRIITPSTRWFFWTVPCRGCASQNNNGLAVPGSIWLSGEQPYEAHLPTFMLRYEAELLLLTQGITL